MNQTARTISVDGPVAIIPLTKGFNCIIDVVDLPLAEWRNWSALVCARRQAVYACRVAVTDGKSRMFLLHRVILADPDGLQVDHIDGDGLNCRRANLRLCSHAENQRNKKARRGSRAGLKGVSWSSRDGIWRAEITLHGKKKFLGNFNTVEAAHAAYCSVAVGYHGAFARLK